MGIPLFALLGLLAGGAVPRVQEGRDGKKPFKLGVVNLKHCFEKDRYERIKEVDTELQKVYADYSASVMETQKKIEGLKLQLEGLKPEMSIYWDKLGQLKLAETELDFKKKFGRQQYLNKYNDLQIQIYNEIRRVVSIYGKEHGFDLILRVEEPQLEEDDNPQGVSARIQSRVVFYYADGVDITADVIKLLNLEYQKQKAAAQQWECAKCKTKNVGPECAKCKEKRPK
ncbi:MAG: OmpH family outer membrane protein [Planctomycetes bacterium]|nr:OmpH family outer membrane protein [Planctomycetota bacterium]